VTPGWHVVVIDDSASVDGPGIGEGGSVKMRVCFRKSAIPYGQLSILAEAFFCTEPEIKYCHRSWLGPVPDPCVTSSTPYENISDVNESLQIEQPYPNPSSSVTRFDIATTMSGVITIRVSTVSGRQVSSTNIDAQSGVRYTVELGNSELPNGVYILQAQIGEKNLSRTFTVLH